MVDNQDILDELFKKYMKDVCFKMFISKIPGRKLFIIFINIIF